MSDYQTGLVTFIGGKNDGKRMRVEMGSFIRLPCPDESPDAFDPSARVTCAVEIELYRREEIACGREAFYVYVFSPLSMEEAVWRLLTQYRPTKRAGQPFD